MDPRDERLAMDAFPELPTEYRHALWLGGIKSWGEVASKSDDELRELEGIGERRLIHIRAVQPGATGEHD